MLVVVVALRCPWVAVIYDNLWYPGVMKKTTMDDTLVSHLHYHLHASVRREKLFCVAQREGHR